MTSATKMVVFNTPHNPSGHVATEHELVKLAELCVKHDVIAVADEVHGWLVACLIFLSRDLCQH